MVWVYAYLNTFASILIIIWVWNIKHTVLMRHIIAAHQHQCVYLQQHFNLWKQHLDMLSIKLPSHSVNLPNNWTITQLLWVPPTPSWQVVDNSSSKVSGVISGVVLPVFDSCQSTIRAMPYWINWCNKVSCIIFTMVSLWQEVHLFMLIACTTHRVANEKNQFSICSWVCLWDWACILLVC